MKEMEEVVIEVRIRRDEYGRITSTHSPQSTEDLAKLQSWSSGGLEQIAFGLLTEAVKREALLDILIQTTKEPSTKNTEETRSLLCAKLQEIMSSTIKRIAPLIIKQTLDDVTV